MRAPSATRIRGGRADPPLEPLRAPTARGGRGHACPGAGHRALQDTAGAGRDADHDGPGSHRRAAVPSQGGLARAPVSD